jgi:hypothetical protein
MQNTNRFSNHGGIFKSNLANVMKDSYSLTQMLNDKPITAKDFDKMKKNIKDIKSSMRGVESNITTIANMVQDILGYIIAKDSEGDKDAITSDSEKSDDDDASVGFYEISYDDTIMKLSKTVLSDTLYYMHHKKRTDKMLCFVNTIKELIKTCGNVEQQTQQWYSLSPDTGTVSLAPNVVHEQTIAMAEKVSSFDNIRELIQDLRDREPHNDNVFKFCFLLRHFSLPFFNKENPEKTGSISENGVRVEYYNLLGSCAAHVRLLLFGTYDMLGNKENDEQIKCLGAAGS